MSARLLQQHDPVEENSTPEKPKKVVELDLGSGSRILQMPRFISYQHSWNYFEYLDQTIPWTRPTIRVFARSHLQPRDTCYVAAEGLPQLVYSGYNPHAYSWDEFPPLKEILDMVHKALPGSSFNSLLLNRYKGGNDYVGWHADDEKLYGPTPQIASVSFGCERDFLLKKKPCKSARAKSAERCEGEPPSKRAKKLNNNDQHAFVLKHGSLLVMSGYTQRDWLHSVPKRAKAESTRINLTFRRIV
ncbi:DNA oxidative demethylase ALKBH2 [Salvia miltiorrhiza]|uniref:DNA oxidative demethylase ALKBH2 n=1 Tax=Salvia miltiorrhiza TaxID=226208 RepID=UPI0025ABC7B1|nr:DNA oxidative demethylase ALKBH2 [Salvia miltiorrhiza]